MQEMLFLFKEGADEMSNCFSDKYVRLRLLYQSSTVKVWLVRSRIGQNLYVAKCANRCTSAATDIFLEAILLQDLRHPGIPIFYELMEENTEIIMIEEYVFGVSLHQYLLYNQKISQETFLNFAIQICEIVSYLHFHRSGPIVYLDMKPEHIIVCGNRLKIIDFGIANFLPISGKNIQKFGTKKYAAPEQKSGKPIGVYTDVYGVGKVLEEMLKHLRPTERIRFRKLVLESTRRNIHFRRKDIRHLICQLNQKKNRINQNRKYLEVSAESLK